MTSTRSKTVLTALALFMLSACSDSLTAPAPAKQGLAPQGLSAVASEDERVIIIRTTDIDPSRADKRYRGEKTHFEKVSVLGHGSTLVTRGVNAPSAVPLSLAALKDGNLPLPHLTAPSNRARSTRGHWVKHRPYTGEPGAVIETRGVNDEPSSEIRLIEGGEVKMTILRVWHRGETSWELQRQEISSADGSVHDVIRIERTGGSHRFDTANGRFGVAGPALSLSAASLAPRFDEECDGGDLSEGDPCQTQVDNLESAEEEALLAGAGILICAGAEVIPVAGTYACALAVITFAKKLKDRDRAQTALDACREFYARKKDCQDHTPFDEGTVHYDSDAGAGDGTADGGLQGCRVYYEYDLATGDITYLEVLYCW